MGPFAAKTVSRRAADCLSFPLGVVIVFACKSQVELVVGRILFPLACRFSAVGGQFVAEMCATLDRS